MCINIIIFFYMANMWCNSHNLQKSLPQFIFELHSSRPPDGQSGITSIKCALRGRPWGWGLSSVKCQLAKQLKFYKALLSFLTAHSCDIMGSFTSEALFTWHVFAKDYFLQSCHQTIWTEKRHTSKWKWY